MTQHPEQQVARLVHLGTEEGDRFGDRLVNGLVEADDVLQTRVIDLTRIYPQAKDR